MNKTVTSVTAATKGRTNQVGNSGIEGEGVKVGEGGGVLVGVVVNVMLTWCVLKSVVYHTQ
jgi:hypothetical protein